MMLHSSSIAPNSAEAPVAYPGAPPDSERAKQPPLPEAPYQPYGEKPALPGIPYQPYKKEPTAPDPPYEPYKDI
jgi:hypothetical protein